MPRGGDRSAQAAANGKKLGRPKNVPEQILTKPDKGIATRVLARIAEEDFWLGFLWPGKKHEDLSDEQVGQRKWALDTLTNRRDGKPAQGVFVGDTRENARELDFGDLPMPASTQLGTAGKPN